MDPIERLRHIARRCHELARLQHGWEAENLTNLGREYEARADRAEAQRRPPAPRDDDRAARPT
jgi:hypothetical protein